MKTPLILLYLLTAVNLYTSGQSFGTIYSSYELERGQQRYLKSNREMLDKALIPFLNSIEKVKLQGIQLNMPKTHRSDPFTFFTDGKSITISAQSMMFFWDLCLAFTWLEHMGYNVGNVTDYVAMIRYKKASAFPGGKYPTPLNALGVPRTAENNKDVYSKALQLFNSARAAIIAHELGHIYYKHPGNYAVSRAESRSNEMEADEFALDLLSRHPEVPAGFLFFQQISSHYNWNSTNSTHPNSSARINNMAYFMERNIPKFARNGNSSELVRSIAGQFRNLAKLLEDEELQMGIQIAAENMTPGALKPIENRNPQSSARFSGQYSGSYIRYLPNRQQETLNVMLILQRRGNVVSGAFNFGFGNGFITEGQVINGVLYFNWSWGRYYGKGVLEKSSDGSLRGTWGYAHYNSPQDNGGRWILRPN